MGKSLKGKELGKGISQRPDGLYVARKMIDGKTVSASGRSLTEVRAKFKEAIREEENRNTGKTTFGSWYETWFNTVKRRKLKCDLDELLFRKKYDNTYPAMIGSARLEDIHQIDIQRVTNELIESGRGVTTIVTGLSTTRQIFKYAVANGLIQTNPCVDIHINTAARKRNPSFALDDWMVRLFFDVMKGRTGYEVLKFMLLTGVRVGELSALKWSDIDFDKGLIHIQRSLTCAHVEGNMKCRFVGPKSESGNRMIPFIGGMRELLTEWREKRQALHEKFIKRKTPEYKEEYYDLVFIVPRTGRPYIRHNFASLMINNRERMIALEEENAKKEGRPARDIPQIHPHLFRHTFASKCFEVGMSPIYVQTIMGHSSYNMTLKYTHMTNETIPNEINKINSAIARF